MNSQAPLPESLTARIVGFCRHARASGFKAGLAESLTSLEAVRAAAPAGLNGLRDVLRTAICKSSDEWQTFGGLFDAYWTSQAANRETERPKEERKRRPPVAGGISAAGLMTLTGGSEPPENAEESKTAAGASVQARLMKVDFSQAPVEQQDLLDALAKRLLEQASRRIARRFKAAARKGRIDLRRTVRASIGLGGHCGKLMYKARAPKPPPLVLLLDVSGSMSLYSLFLLRFAHAMGRHFKRADTFIFSTNLVDIRSELRSRELAGSFRALSERAAGWSGGTKIGRSLREFNRMYSSLLSRNTLFLILSDGWDTGEPEELSGELRAVRERVRCVIWLNPLLGMEEYSPETRGMRAALPHIDVFAPAHSLESLLDLEKVFRRVAR